MSFQVSMSSIGQTRNGSGDFTNPLRVTDFETAALLAEFETCIGGQATMSLRRYSGAPCWGASLADRLSVLRNAVEKFQGTLTIGGESQTLEQFVDFQVRASGSPRHVVNIGVDKCVRALQKAEAILAGLISDMWPSASLDQLWEMRDVEGHDLMPGSNVLGAVLPSNAMGTNSLYLPLLPWLRGAALKVGSRDPMTPVRLVQALIEAGVPEQFLGLYANAENDHTVSSAIAAAPVAMVFGNAKSTRGYLGNPRVEVHGPGVSKIIIPGYMVDEVFANWHIKWRQFFIDSIDGNNCGKSCICTSAIWMPRRAKEFAQLLADDIGAWEPKDVNDPEGKIAAFTSADSAGNFWKDQIKPLLEHPVIKSATPVDNRVVTHDHHSYMRPVILFCSEPSHPAATGLELPFHMVTVVECPDQDMIARCGRTLIASLLTDGEEDCHVRAALSSRHIDQVNINEPTTVLHMGRPHEGNSLRLVCQNQNPVRYWMTDTELKALADAS